MTDPQREREKEREGEGCPDGRLIRTSRLMKLAPFFLFPYSGHSGLISRSAAPS